jgi:hypothetical protein
MLATSPFKFGSKNYGIILPFGNRVLTSTCGPNREGVGHIRGWRNLHNEELHDLCSSSNIIRKIK